MSQPIDNMVLQLQIPLLHLIHHPIQYLYYDQQKPLESASYLWSEGLRIPWGNSCDREVLYCHIITTTLATYHRKIIHFFNCQSPHPHSPISIIKVVAITTGNGIFHFTHLLPKNWQECKKVGRENVTHSKFKIKVKNYVIIIVLYNFIFWWKNLSHSSIIATMLEDISTSMFLHWHCCHGHCHYRCSFFSLNHHICLLAKGVSEMATRETVVQELAM